MTVPSAILKKLNSIKLLVLDVDGILTDNTVFWMDEATGFRRTYSIRDGYGIRLLLRHQFPVAVISAGDSRDVIERMKYLGIPDVYMGTEEKLPIFLKLCKKHGVKPSEAAYMGDELFDIPTLKAAGFSATVPEAIGEVKKIVDYVTKIPGGRGATREITDAIRKVRGFGPKS